MGRGGNRSKVGLAQAGLRRARPGPSAELRQVITSSEQVLQERVRELNGQEDISPALVVSRDSGNRELIDLAAFADLDPAALISTAIPALLEEANAKAAAFISEAWEPAPELPEGRREVVIVIALDAQGIGMARQGEVRRTSGRAELGMIESAPANRVPPAIQQALISGLGVGVDRDAANEVG
jgi:hypothetical protein